MVSLTPDHQVACHLYTESAQKYKHEGNCEGTEQL